MNIFELKLRNYLQPNTTKYNIKWGVRLWHNYTKSLRIVKSKSLLNVI